MEPMLLRVDYAPSTLPTVRGLVALSVRQALLQVQSDYLFKDVLGYSDEMRAAFDYLADPQRLPVSAALRNARARKSVVVGKRGLVRVDHWGGSILYKKT